MALLEAIAREQALLARLDREQAEARARLAALQIDLASLATEPEIRVEVSASIQQGAPQSNAEKVRLIRSLFRGREDVFPTRFVRRIPPPLPCCPPFFHEAANSFERFFIMVKIC